MGGGVGGDGEVKSGWKEGGSSSCFMSPRPLAFYTSNTGYLMCSAKVQHSLLNLAYVKQEKQKNY